MPDTSDTNSLDLPQSGRPGRLYGWIFSGLVVSLAAFPLLFWNESRALHQYRNQQQGTPEVHSVRMDRIDPEMNGKLVHVHGPAITGETLRDPVFGVAANAVKLRRQVEVYQWRETRTTPSGEAAADGKGPAVIPEKGWAEHPDPPAPYYSVEAFTAGTVTLGAYTLSRPFIEQIDRFRPLKLDRGAITRLPPELRWDAHRMPHGFFIGEDPKAPRIGDMRVTFQAAGPLTVSVVGRQAGNRLLPYPTDRGEVALLRVGAHSIDGMFPRARRHSAILSWGLRLGGFGLMFAGLTLILVPPLRRAEPEGSFLKGVADRVDPWLLAFLMASALSFATIAAVWFVVRPLLAAVLVGTAAAFIIGLWMLPERHAG